MTDNTGAFEVRAFDPQQATDGDWKELNAFSNQMQQEALPDDPPLPTEERKRSWQAIPPIIERHAWIVRVGTTGKIIAMGYTDLAKLEENQHLAQASIQVLPGARRQGIGSRLLAKLAKRARQENRRLLIGETMSTAAAGEAFARWLGATAGLATHMNQLRIDEVGRGLLENWVARAKERAHDYELGLWEGAYPEEALATITGIKEAMNQQPRGSLEVEDMRWTADLLRQLDASLAQRGITRWSYCVRNKSTGALAGYTELFWRPSKPHIGEQGDTAVLEAHRNHGLGRWLKAAMLLKLLHERPDVRFVRTLNADSNAPMLKINEELGFRPYLATTLWQVEIERVQKRLAEKGIF